MKWENLLKDYKDQRQLCEYLQSNQWTTRTEWAAAWTSHHRHYGMITNSPVEGMHKVLKDYLQTSRGDLLRVVGNIEQMVQSQHNKYTKDLGSGKHSVKFRHKLESAPFLPHNLSDILTPAALEHIKQQEELRLKAQRAGCCHPCSGLFEKANGLPCHHTMQRAANSVVPLLFPYDDHWRYKRLQQGQSIDVPPRPYQTIREPHPAQTRGRPRRDEASTRRDPSAFERRVPASTTIAASQSQGETLAEILSGIAGGLADPIAGAVITATSASAAATVTASASASMPLAALSPAFRLAPRLSPERDQALSRSASPVPSQVSINVSITLSSPSTRSHITVASPATEPAREPAKAPLSLEEFLADIEYRRHQRPLGTCRNPNELASYMADTGQENDSVELVEARNMALATTGMWGDCTPTMAWHYFFGNRRVFEDGLLVLAAQRRAKEDQEAQEGATRRPKRAAAERAAGAWKELSPRKRQRRQ
jgi:hypothetical protein